MRRAILPLIALLSLPAMAQTHLGVPGGKMVQLVFKHAATDAVGWRSSMVQVTNDGSSGMVFKIPFGQALVITDISMESSVPFNYAAGSLNGGLYLRWVNNSIPTAAGQYSETFRALGASTTVTVNRSFTGGRIYAYHASNVPGILVDTPWDPTGNGTNVMVTGYVVAYP